MLYFYRPRHDRNILYRYYLPYATSPMRKKEKVCPLQPFFSSGSLINLVPEPGMCLLVQKCKLQAQRGRTGTSDRAGIIDLLITYRLLEQYLGKGSRGCTMRHFYYLPIPANPSPPGWYPLHKNSFPGHKLSYFCSIL